MQMRTNRIAHLITNRFTRNILFWLLFAFLHYYPRDSIASYLLILSFFLVSYGIPVYINNFILLPRYLVKRKYGTYIAGFLPLLVAAIAGTGLLLRWVAPYLPVGESSMMGPMMTRGLPARIFAVLLVFVLMAFGKFLHDAIRHERDAERLQQQRLQAELAHLHAQINPHFLFNALNTLFGMARRTDLQMAGAVMQLSDILRHNLYECEKPDIPVAEELNVIRQYIAFSRLRLVNDGDIRLLIEADAGEQRIAPLLLLPLIENAFKYGLVTESEGLPRVDIRLCLRENELCFTCANSYSERDRGQDGGGIGLNNVRRRLQLYYPGRHQLQAGSCGETFRVSLKIQLT